MKFADIMAQAASFLYPKKCACCRKLLKEPADLCDKCRKDIERMGEKICVWCGQEQKQCECKFRVYRFRGVVAPFKNTGLVQQAFYDFKFHKRLANAPFFAKEMASFVKKYYGDIKFDAICPVPMFYFDKANRGYNQSEMLAKDIARIVGVKMDAKIIYARKKKKVQHQIKSITKRYSNIKGRYYYKNNVHYENVLLVDDIKTTGATLDECARQLMLAGVNNVYCITALITNPRLKKSVSKDIIKNKSGDKNGN